MRLNDYRRHEQGLSQQTPEGSAVDTLVLKSKAVY